MATETDLNEQLTALYKGRWRALCMASETVNKNKNLPEKATGPLLISVADKKQWSSADIRLMFFGQETNGWYEKDHDIGNICDCYREFYNGGQCYTYGGQFWNGIKKLLNDLSAAFPDRKVAAIWNNIVKIGKSSGRGFPPEYIYQGIERRYFSVVDRELAICKPNVVIFLTGPNYDSVIADVFGQMPYKAIPPFSSRQLSRVYLKKVPFSVRTYHPNYLWRNGIDRYFRAIIRNLAKSIE